MRKILLVCLLITALASCKVGRFFIYNFANITDYKKFPKRDLIAPEKPFQFIEVEKQRAPKQVTLNKSQKVPFETFLEDSKTVAFLIIKEDSLLYEGYFNRYQQEDIVASFSMAKSVTSMLIGFAIQEGLIKSVDEPVSNYIPELAEQGFDKVTIEHLLQMTSGLKFNESYTNPFGHAASYYYGRNLRKTVVKAKLEHSPGTHFDYQSGSTQILGMVLDRALVPREQTVTQYLQEKIWTPLQMEYDASWSIDKKKNGMEKTFCCLNARARDFAKLGRFYLQMGNWEGEQLLDSNWIKRSTAIDTTNGSEANYQYQWWLLNQEPDYTAQGILGQFIYIHPEKKLIMVRLGKKYGGMNWTGLFRSLAKVY